MAIDSIGIDLEEELGLEEWLSSDSAQTAQKYLEEKITQALFSHHPTSPVFQTMAIQLAWIGAQAEVRPFLEKEIIALKALTDFSFESCGLELGKKLANTCKAVGHFVSDHILEIVAGVAICATGVGIAAAGGYSLSVSIGGVVVAGAGSIFQSAEKPNPHIPKNLPDPNSCSRTERAAIEEALALKLPKLELPSNTQEILVTAEGVWANGQFFSTDLLRQHSLFSSFFQETQLQSSKSDWKISHAYLARQQEITDHARGESALVLGNYAQAVQDLGKAIETNPNHSLSYLERGAAHFNLGHYEQAYEDYHLFASQTKTTPTSSLSEFCLGFAKGLPKGAYESGEGILLFLVDFAKHPIQTAKQTIDSISTLVHLVRQDEWSTIAEALSPEMHRLVTEWDQLTSIQRGELAGYALAKHGADILLPGTIAKVASKSVKSAQELVAVCKNLQIAQETLLLEAAAGIGNSAKVADAVRNGQTMMALSEELGFTNSEIGQLKHAGKLESAVNTGLDKLVSQSESEVLRAAIYQNKHIKMVRDYLDKSTKEVQKGIISYEKQITLHKDKIANPIKYCPDWDKLDPRQQEALINKKWPTEIKVYEEQKNILQSILNERLSHE
jgi:tetratricopeptide (TPR) repeat protein